jgi:hypothetical protein
MCAPLIVLLALAACGQGTDAATPAAQQKATSMNGKPHILEQRGSFVVTRDISICVTQPYYDSELVRQAQNLPMVDSMLVKSLEAKIKDMGHEEWLKNATTGVWFGKDAISHCPDNGHNIIIHQSLSLNAAGTPYRIEMSARQGAALARVGVERKDRSDYPSYWGQFADKITDPPNFQPIFIEEMKMLSPILINAIFN